MSSTQIKVYRDLMGANAEWAAKTRDLLKEKNITMLNIIGSPGCGKTTLLENIAKPLREKGVRMAVLEGDVETTHDAERLDALQVPVSQLLTGGTCHLEAKLVYHALIDLPVNELDIIFVENVGNLVCPAEFDIGEAAKIAVLSITEGEDKPVKYPLLFTEAKAVLLTKVDLLPHLSFDIQSCLDYIHKVNPHMPIFQHFSIDGSGMEEWLDWVIGWRSDEKKGSSSS